MLSVANPPDSSCSFEVAALNSDEKGQHSTSPKADPAGGPDEEQHPHFSIRDYVFVSRSKDVGTNWPFPQQYLQLCVKHGVRDLLPPFEPPDLVRSRFSDRHVQVDHLSVCSEVEETQTEVSDAVKCSFSLPTQVSGSAHQPHNPLLEDKRTVVQAAGSDDASFHGEAESEVTDHDHTRSTSSSVSQFPGSVQETSSAVLESSAEVEVTKPPPSAENFSGTSERPVKECRLIVKFGGAPESSRTEDTVSNSSLVSDPMASKVCPVCKIFASTSNTTLNAHIDQCLSAETNAKWDAIKLSQHKVKPRKKRSMEEICATAPCCTLEDLDRRNGTNWALDFFSMTENNGASRTTESRQPRISHLKVTDDEKEGALYVDSNGTKLLILSKFNDAQIAAAADWSVPKKCKKEFKSKSPPSEKRKCLPPKYRKYLKAKVQRKKMNSVNRFEIHNKFKIHAGTHHEEGTISQAANPPEQIKVGKPGTLGHWICSKRSSLLKHLNRRSGHRRPRNPLATTNHKSVESDKSAAYGYFAIGQTQKFCKSPGEILSPPKARSTDVFSEAVLTSLNQGKHSADVPEKNVRSIGINPSTSNSIMLKLSRSTGKCVSSAKSKRVVMHANVVEKSAKFQSLSKNSVGCHPQVHKGEKGSRRSISMAGQQCSKEGIKCNEAVQGVVSKRLRKHRFSDKLHQPVKELPLELAEGSHGSPGVRSLGAISNNVMSGMHQSSFSDNVERLEPSNTLDLVSPHEHNTVNSNQADVHYHALEGGEHCTLNHSQHEAECDHAEVTEFDAQIEVPANYYGKIVISEDHEATTCDSEDVISEEHEATTWDRLDSCPSLEHERECSIANEAATEASLLKLLGDQGMHYGVIASDIVRPDIWKVGQVGSSMTDGYCSELQNMKYQADIASSQFSSACLTRYEDKVREHGSSMTSGRSVTAEIHNIVVDGEPSGSPVSAASTISHLSVEDLRSKDAEREPSEEPVVIQEILRPDPRNLRLLVDDSVRGTEQTDPEETFQRLKATTSTQDHEDLWDGQTCCCARRESIPCKFRILRQSAMAGMMLPTKTKHMTSSLYTRTVVSSGTYSHSTSERKVIPISDSPIDSMSAKVSSDFGIGFPTFGSFGSASPPSHGQPQSASSPVLRLMGKNLMVVNKEERSVQQQTQSLPCPSEDASNGNYTPLHGFSSTCSFSNLDSIQYHPHQSLEGSMLGGQHPSNVQAPVPLPAEPMGCFAGSLLQSVAMMKPDSHAHQKWLDKKPNLSAMYNSNKVSTPHEQQTPIPIAQAPIPGRDIVVIDDSPEHENEASGSMKNPPSLNMAPPFYGSDFRRVRSFSCYPSLNRFQPRELGHGLKPGFPISCPTRNTTSTSWGSTSGSSVLPLPRHVIPSHSAGQEAKTLYHSLSFR